MTRRTYEAARRELERDWGELIDRQERVDAGRDLSAYIVDPVGFFRDVLDSDPWSRQRDIAQAVVEEPLVTVRSCHAAGKDWLAARLALWWCYARNGMVVLTGPSATQVEEILMRGEIRTAFRGSGLPGDLHVKALRPGGEGKAGILAKTARGVSALTGFHDARVLFVVTEAQDPEIEHAWDAAFAVATGEHDRVVTLGNPTVTSGRFYRAHQSGSDWHAIKIAASDVPNVREGETVVPGLLTREGVERFRGEYGEQSPTYRSRVEAEFPDTAEDSLVKGAWLSRAVEDHREDVFRAERERAYYTLGVDVSAAGPDKSLVCVRSGPHVEGFRELEGEKSEDVAREVYALVGELHRGGESPVRRVVVDEVGVGWGVFTRAQDLVPRTKWWESGRDGTGLRRKRTAVAGFNAGAKPPAADRFLNLRAQAFWHVRTLLEEGELALPDDPELINQLRQTRHRLTPEGKVALEAKTRIKSRLGGRSPDKADALSMTFLTELEDTSSPKVRWK